MSGPRESGIYDNPTRVSSIKFDLKSEGTLKFKYLVISLNNIHWMNLMRVCGAPATSKWCMDYVLRIGCVAGMNWSVWGLSEWRAWSYYHIHVRVSQSTVWQNLLTNRQEMQTLSQIYKPKYMGSFELFSYQTLNMPRAFVCFQFSLVAVILFILSRVFVVIEWMKPEYMLRQE